MLWTLGIAFGQHMKYKPPLSIMFDNDYIQRHPPSIRHYTCWWPCFLYDTPGLAPRMNVLFWGPDDFPVSYSNRDTLKSSFRKFYGRYGDLIQQYEVSLSRMLNGILILDQQWLPSQSDFPPISWPLYIAWPSPIMSGFHGAFCNGCGMPAGNAYPSGHLVCPPLWDLLVLQLLRPDSSNLPCLYSTFHLEHPLVFYRFCS